MATYKVKSSGKEHTVTVVDKAGGGATVTVEGQTFEVEVFGAAARVAPVAAVAASPVASPTPAPSAPVAAGSGSIVAPMPGKIIGIHVKVGDRVSALQVVLVLEAMKMENNIASPVEGTVKEVHVSEGTEVEDGKLLMVIE